MTGRGPQIATAAAVILGLWLRWRDLSCYGLWFDEGYTAWVVSLPVGQLIRAVRADTAPPLYYLLLRAWAGAFGRSEVGLRSLSATAATVGLVAFLPVVRRLLTDPWARAGAVALFAASYMQAAYAHECRFYAGMSMLGVVDLYLVLLACERSTRRATAWRLSGVATAWTLSLYLNNVMAVYLAALAVAWLVLPGDRPRLRRVFDLCVVSAVAAAAFAVWVPAVLAQTRAVRDHYWTSPPDADAFARAVSGLVGVNDQGVGGEGDGGRWGVLVAVAACVAVGGIVRRSRRVTAAVAAFAALPVLGLFAYSRVGQSVFIERAFLVSGVGLAVLVMVPVEVAPPATRRRVAAGCWAVCLGGSVARSIPGRWTGEHPEPWREACRYASSSPAAARAVVCVANEGELLWDYYGRGGSFGPAGDVTGAPADFFAPDPPRTMRQVTTDADLAAVGRLLDGGRFDELVVLASHTAWSDPDGHTLNLIRSRLAEVDRRTFVARPGGTPVVVVRFRLAGGAGGVKISPARLGPVSR